MSPMTHDSETRLIDRRCRCSRPATELHRDCFWHDSVSAQYARDLLAEVVRLRATSAPRLELATTHQLLDEVSRRIEELQ